MRVMLLDVKKGTGLQGISIPDKLSAYYEKIGCQIIDIVMRRIGGRDFDIICDDERLFDEHPIVSALDCMFSPALVGNLIFAHHDADGNMTGLNLGDEEIIRNAQIQLYDTVRGENHTVIMFD